ncbi:MAG TPA: hypothetical protein VMR76_01540 [Candidatus Saccharimonadia bacterium]|nr:hypothetical protein [Candidatus Saccharimonadia bacterium]
MESRIETDDREHAWKSELFSSWCNGSEGEADGFIQVDPNGIDVGLKHEDWPTPQIAQRIFQEQLSGAEQVSLAIRSYGFRVYRDLLEEEGYENVYLHPAIFMSETNLLDILAEAIKCSVDEEHSELATTLVVSMINTARGGNFADKQMRKYLDVVMASNNFDAIRVYVDFMNDHTVKGPDDAKDFLKRMAHAVRDIPLKSPVVSDTAIDRVKKQVLLEDIGHAWIRKSMPTAEIDWLA